jgi:hypothetical protein
VIFNEENSFVYTNGKHVFAQSRKESRKHVSSRGFLCDFAALREMPLAL